MPSKTLIIVDGYSLLFRAFFGTRFLSTADGRPTNALFGFTSMLFALMEKHRPDCLVVALDAHEKTFRHEEYEAYKGTRRETAPELVEQLIFSRELIAAFGLPTVEKGGYEADDVVGTISLHAERNGYHTYIISGDMDASQLVDEHVTLVTPKQGVSEVFEYTPERVVERYGFGPEFIPDYKALVGDTSDNIPGVPGIGEKSATALITKFGPVEEIMRRLPEVEEKFRKKLEPVLGQIPMSKRLATIVRDAPIEFDFKPFQLSQSQLDAAQAMLTSLEFRNHAKKVVQILGPYVDGAAIETHVGVKEQSLEPRMGEKLASAEDAAKWVNGRPFALVMMPGAPAANLLDEPSPDMGLIAIGDEVRELVGTGARRLVLDHPELAILHDAKSLYHGSGVLTPPRFDSMIAGYVLQSGRSSYGLRELVQGYLDVAEPGTGPQLAMGLGQLEGVMRERVVKENQQRVLDEIELPLIPILAEMEDFGIRVSSDFLTDFSKTLEVQIGEKERMIHEIAGQKFTINSPKQLGEILFEKLGIPGGKRTKTGWATGAEILVEIDHPIVQEILGYRELSKLKSTYADALPRMVKLDGRIHTSFNQTVAATGRLSSNEPNLQNIPIRTELGRQIRTAFVAGDGYTLASYDYSQIELRLLAHLCRDEALVEAFQKRVDVHTVTASLMFGSPESEVTKEQRRLAKMLNYAVLYGVTDFGLAQQLGEGFGVSEARSLIEQYFERFPAVKAFTVSIIEEARAKGFTSTMVGRRRYFPDIHAANRAERLYAERQAVNAPIQGAAADLVKMAMIDVRKKLSGVKTRMLLQVHDELLFEMAFGEEDSMREPIRQAMENALPISVPIEVDAKFGANWNEMAP